jgi:hypothetical protein
VAERVVVKLVVAAWAATPDRALKVHTRARLRAYFFDIEDSFTALGALRGD